MEDAMVIGSVIRYWDANVAVAKHKAPVVRYNITFRSVNFTVPVPDAMYVPTARHMANTASTNATVLSESICLSSKETTSSVCE
jgi:hypothetical protein